MHKQTDKDLLEVIQNVGCFYLSIANMIEFRTAQKLSSSQLNDIWLRCKKLYIIDKDDNILSGSKVANQMLQVLKSDYICLEIGLQKFFDNLPRNEYYNGISNKLKNSDKYYIRKLKTYGKYGTHFIFVTENGNIYDSKPCEWEKIIYSIIFCFTKRG